MLRRISTAVVALSLAVSGGQAATPTGDQGAPSANQASAVIRCHSVKQAASRSR